ncbi:MAG: efflux RND transporter periplasmic adaptor subunit [Thermoanaerobaculia bacterium]
MQSAQSPEDHAIRPGRRSRFARLRTHRAAARPGITLAAGALALLTSLAALGCRGSASDSGPRGRAPGEGPPPSVEAVAARYGSLPLEQELSGIVRAENQVAIRPEIEAVVAEVLVRSGDAVERGQPLVRLADDPLREQLRQAEANLRRARGAAAEARARVAEVEAQVTRTRALAAEDLVPQVELDTQEARLEAVQAQAEQTVAQVDEIESNVEERRTALSKTMVRAPIAGRVGRRNVEPGKLVDPSTTLFLIGELDRMIVEVPLTDAMLVRTDEGTPAQVTPPGSAEPLEAEISRISPFLEPGSFSTTAEIDVANPEARLRPGMFVAVRILHGATEEATLVPASALWEDPRTGIRGVYVVQDVEGLEEPEVDASPGAAAAGDRSDPGVLPEEVRPVVFRPVETLAEGRGVVGVEGVEPGEWVVTVGQQLLHQEQESMAADGDAGAQGAGGAEDRRRREAAGSAEGADPGEATVAARVRPTSWAQVAALQDLQDEDLLRGFLERHRVAVRAFGAEIPEDPHAVDDLVAEAANEGTGGN